MRLLITTQKVNKTDARLGFFHGWIEEFARHCEKVTVICLEEGEHSLPENVSVYSLGKEQKVSRLQYIGRFYSLIWSKRNEYDAVFVHMNPEYVVLGGLLWRLLGKKIGLWYMHKSVDLKLRIAELFTHYIFTATPESFRLKSEKVHITGHGIDTDFFAPGATVSRGEHFLSVGRLDPVKRHDLAIEAARDAEVPLRIVGEGSERVKLDQIAAEKNVHVSFLGSLSHTVLRDEYRRAAKFIHRSETGSLDKVVLEALACGCPIDTSDPALKFLETETSTYVREHHSLQSLVPRILHFYE